MRRTLTATLALALAFGAGAYANSQGYIDVFPGDTHQDGIQWMTSKGYMEGKDGRFYPERAVTRAQLATILYRMSDEYVPPTTTTTRPGDGTISTQGGTTTQATVPDTQPSPPGPTGRVNDPPPSAGTTTTTPALTHLMNCHVNFLLLHTDRDSKGYLPYVGVNAKECPDGTGIVFGRGEVRSGRYWLPDDIWGSGDWISVVNGVQVTGVNISYPDLDYALTTTTTTLGDVGDCSVEPDPVRLDDATIAVGTNRWTAKWTVVITPGFGIGPLQYDYQLLYTREGLGTYGSSVFSTTYSQVNNPIQGWPEGQITKVELRVWPKDRNGDRIHDCEGDLMYLVGRDLTGPFPYIGAGGTPSTPTTTTSSTTSTTIYQGSPIALFWGETAMDIDGNGTMPDHE